MELRFGLARNAEKLNTIQKKLGNTFVPVTMDITDPQATIAWVQKTFSDSHIPHILINNVGAGYFSIIDQLPLERWHGNRIKVNQINKVAGSENIFTIGDISYMETPKYPKGHPQLANVAIN